LSQAGARRAVAANADADETAVPLPLSKPDAHSDAGLLRLAAEAIRAIDHRLAELNQAM
jgi:hypothetical protein